ncbi:hypothetical protein HD597_003722 [Nonomuraea thailandensis]|uniref:non-specific serine/threonine protein kinase n=1 Tax=Nonomuraea thailandensis TaxID=1188745 RepID=A0A9X2GD84_9ACTN|nr:hypothetical protein [Nonomuraea thailandensis]
MHAPLRPGDPERVREYRLTARLGEGGQGTVFLGMSPTGTRVAVKLLRADLAQDEEALERFVREVSTTRRVSPFCTATAIGTPSYMAPEQFAGEDAGSAADMFAWGCTMVFAASGRPPFGTDSLPADGPGEGEVVGRRHLAPGRDRRRPSTGPARRAKTHRRAGLARSERRPGRPRRADPHRRRLRVSAAGARRARFCLRIADQVSVVVLLPVLRPPCTSAAGPVSRPWPQARPGRVGGGVRPARRAGRAAS